LALVPDPTVSFVRPLLATKRLGITVGDAYMSDGKAVRFRVLSRDHPTVQLISPSLPTPYRSAIEAWLRRQKEVEPA
jgi:hypothetical protein